MSTPVLRSSVPAGNPGAGEAANLAGTEKSGVPEYAVTPGPVIEAETTFLPRFPSMAAESKEAEVRSSFSVRYSSLPTRYFGLPSEALASPSEGAGFAPGRAHSRL